MSESINLIKEAERSRTSKPSNFIRPRLADGLKFQSQPPLALDKFSPNDPQVSEEKSSSGLMVDDSGSDKECK